MKYLKVFENFLNEGSIRKFLTGHKNGEELDNAENKILNDIEIKVDKLYSAGHLKEEDVVKYKDKLKKQSKDNNWKGKVSLRKSKTGRYFVVYDDGTSTLQEIGKVASGR